MIGSASAQKWALPPAPELSTKGRDLIYEYETGGKGRLPNKGHPEVPGEKSGVTVGIGYDCGYNRRAIILGDWSKLNTVARLAATAEIKGAAAKAILPQVSDILVEWELASEVFDNVSVPKFYSRAALAFPGLGKLRPNAQTALLSLVFNRGDDMAGPRREEMREIRDLVPKKDYQGIADAILSMKRLWPDKKNTEHIGLRRRRDAEAELVLTP